MPKPLLPFLHRYVSRHGRPTYYVKLSKAQRGRGTRITDRVYRSEAFMLEYHALVRGTSITSGPVGTKDGKGTLGWFIRLYRESRDWGHNLSDGTRKQRGPILKQMEASAGDLPLGAITRRKVEEGMSARTGNQARHFLNTVSGLFRWAIANELFDGRNPGEGITRTRNDGDDNDGHLPWPIELIEQYEKRWPLGTKQRLLFDIYLYVGPSAGRCGATRQAAYAPGHHSSHDREEPRQDADLRAGSPRAGEVHQRLSVVGAGDHRQGRRHELHQGVAGQLLPRKRRGGRHPGDEEGVERKGLFRPRPAKGVSNHRR
jgi:hypothetical protein